MEGGEDEVHHREQRLAQVEVEVLDHDVFLRSHSVRQVYLVREPVLTLRLRKLPEVDTLCQLSLESHIVFRRRELREISHLLKEVQMLRQEFIGVESEDLLEDFHGRLVAWYEFEPEGSNHHVVDCQNVLLRDEPGRQND